MLCPLSLLYLRAASNINWAAGNLSFSTVLANVVVVQVVDGNRLMNTPYDLSFRADRDHVSLCSRQLTQNEIQKFRKVA